MTTTNRSPGVESRLPQSRFNNPRSLRLIRVFSWIITAIVTIQSASARGLKSPG